ncbi:MAG: PhoH family protein [Eubacteriales bacterium]|nr:PhoH family protein [Eubacteriales bacterium]MDD4323541.1 PhoH family protein [Eubacteriales bacterium]MDD4541406.1 PhoH family protein [Eubacteriales bacterium]
MKKSRKTFVLDTNVLLNNPYALYSFEDNIVVIPEVVLEELDKFKKDDSELGANARHVARLIDALREKGSLNTGIELENGGTLRIEMNFHDVKLPESWVGSVNDNRILKVCKGLHEKNEKVYLVSKDIFIRIKADVLGITAQDFFAEQSPDIEEQYAGRLNVYTTEEKLNDFYLKSSLKPEDVFEFSPGSGKEHAVELTTNQFLIIHSSTNDKQTALARFNGREIVPLSFLQEHPFGVTPRNAGQKFMQEALMMDADKAPLVIIKGPAGTAKTFYSIAVGLHKMLSERPTPYRKILVCRPNVKFDEDIGYLPGTEQEKIAPFLRPVIDNLEVLIDQGAKEKYNCERELKDKIDELFDRNIISTEAMTFIRGHSIAKQWVIIDEAQNLTPKQVKGIITRAGMEIKIILVGDPEQIDHPFLDIRTNGLSYASEKMKGSSLCHQITLTDEECERSKLAFEAAKRM